MFSLGIQRRLRRQLSVTIYTKYWTGYEKMDVPGKPELVRENLAVTSLQYYNGYGRTDGRGEVLAFSLEWL